MNDVVGDTIMLQENYGVCEQPSTFPSILDENLSVVFIDLDLTHPKYALDEIKNFNWWINIPPPGPVCPLLDEAVMFRSQPTCDLSNHPSKNYEQECVFHFIANDASLNIMSHVENANEVAITQCMQKLSTDKDKTLYETAIDGIFEISKTILDEINSKLPMPFTYSRVELFARNEPALDPELNSLDPTEVYKGWHIDEDTEDSNTPIIYRTTFLLAGEHNTGFYQDSYCQESGQQIISNLNNGIIEQNKIIIPKHNEATLFASQCGIHTGPVIQDHRLRLSFYTVTVDISPYIEMGLFG